MLKLCCKDYLASRWLWLSVAVLYILYIVQPMGQTILVMALGLLVVYATLSITMIFEDQSRTETLYVSLPLERKTIVRARYLLGGLIMLGGAVLIFGSAALALAVLKAPAYEKALSPLLSFDGIAGYFAAAVLLLASFVPLSYRFGLGRGNVIYAGGLVVFFSILAGLERLASRTLHLISPVFTVGFFKDPGVGTIGLIGSIRAALGTLLFVGSGLALLSLLTVLSLWLATRLYERKEF